MKAAERHLLEQLFPEELLRYFEITDSKKTVKDKEEIIEVEFTEYNQLPEGYSKEEYEPKDFTEKKIIDFPIRGRGVILKLRRRRWRHKQTKATLSRDLTFIAEGTRFTEEVAAFFKGDH